MVAQNSGCYGDRLYLNPMATSLDVVVSAVDAISIEGDAGMLVMSRM